MAGEQKDFLEMSDEDFLKLNAPGATPADEPAEDPEIQTSSQETPGAAVADPDVEPAADPVVEPAAETPELVAAAAPEQPATSDPVPTPGSEPAADVTAKEPAAEPTGDVAPDYEGFFKQVMTPFKANGRTIELKNPDEAIRLMQMGAGYGKKIQELQPHLKVIRMLEKNNLLDEGKLSFLIDINQKNPDAIKKIIQDSGIDPLEINTEDNVDYRPQNHAVSDKELAFHTALTDVQTQPSGQETIQIINQTWDETSKAVLWDKPEVLAVIQTQRENGIYDQIAAEIDRQKLLGHIPRTTPFMEAYTAVGDQMMKANAFRPPEHLRQTLTAHQPQPQVLATRTVQPKPQVQHSDKAKAATPTPTTQRKAATTVNPLDMPDDEFMKQFAGRF